MVKKPCEDCNSLGYFEHFKSVYQQPKIDYFCCIKGDFVKDLNDLCECWIKSKNIVREIVNKECDRLGRIDEVITII